MGFSLSPGLTLQPGQGWVREIKASLSPTFRNSKRHLYSKTCVCRQKQTELLSCLIFLSM